MISVGVLGATGMVGQRFIQLLQDHPKFKITAVGASERSAGQLYRDACRHWKLDTPIPEDISGMAVKLCQPQYFDGCQIIFSGLDSDVAGDIELQFRDAGFAVFSNAKNHRMDPMVPLVVPLVNPEHLKMVSVQKQKLQKSGFVVTNANCSTTGLVVPLKALHDKYGLKQINVCTLQAISGAGYPGLSAIDILGNVVPFIDGEELKIEVEPLKILGSFQGDKFVDASFQIDAACHRVPVIDGHVETVSIVFHNKPASIEEVKQVLASYQVPSRTHSSPKHAIIVKDELNRPQPKLDLMNGDGYSVTVGRVRKGNSHWDVVFTIFSHNTILGAAGSSILNAEIASDMKLL